MENCYILVDYANVEVISKRKGLKFIAEGIISRLDDIDFEKNIRITIRLYGGWYQDQNITKLAQDLSSEILGNFPTIIKNSASITFNVNIELAYSLLISPKEHLLATYRIRGYPTDLKIPLIVIIFSSRFDFEWK